VEIRWPRISLGVQASLIFIIGIILKGSI
jgi:hypothetical protein